jgi:hypothetical protein
MGNEVVEEAAEPIGKRWNFRLKILSTVVIQHMDASRRPPLRESKLKKWLELATHTIRS